MNYVKRYETQEFLIVGKPFISKAKKGFNCAIWPQVGENSCV